MTDRISDFCRARGIEPEVRMRATTEGYYAAHVSFPFEFAFQARDLSRKLSDITVELQLPTQVQEVIRTLLHRQYEKRRLLAELGNEEWVWDPQDEQFALNYLGHILHYIEGMILRVREGQVESG